MGNKNKIHRAPIPSGHTTQNLRKVRQNIRKVLFSLVQFDPTRAHAFDEFVAGGFSEEGARI